MVQNSTPTVHKSLVITQLIGIFGFVVVPALITLVAPLTQLELSSQKEGVVAISRKCLFFVLPYRTEEVRPVVEVRDKLQAARSYTASERRRGNRGQKMADGTLILQGTDHEVWITVSPERVKAVAEQVRQFVAQPTAEPLRLFLPAHWIFTYIVGGVATFFAGLYVVGSVLAIMAWCIKKLGPHAGSETHTTGASDNFGSDSI